MPVGLGYGGIMQAFALKTVLTQLGHEVILIRRIGKKHKLKRIIRRTIKKYVFGKKDTIIFIDRKEEIEYPIVPSSYKHRKRSALMELKEEFSIKLGRVRKLMEEKGLDGVFLKRQDDFAWLSCGGRNYVGAGDMGNQIFVKFQLVIQGIRGGVQGVFQCGGFLFV